MTQHHKNADEVLRELGTDSERGLTSAQVAELREKFGANRLKEKKKKTMLQRFLEQFKDVMILILLAAAVVSFVVACTGHDPMEFFEPVLILLIVVLNAVMGVVQESKAEHALEALQSLSAPHTRVIRDGVEQIIDASIMVMSCADNVKTSTGFGKAGATAENVKLMRQVVGPKFGVKAAGGVRTKEAAKEMIEAGATRIGASSPALFE